MVIADQRRQVLKVGQGAADQAQHGVATDHVVHVELAERDVEGGAVEGKELHPAAQCHHLALGASSTAVSAGVAVTDS